MMASLLLCGTMSAQHYTPNAHDHETNMPIVAQVTLDGTVPTATNLELGAYIDGTVRGSATLQSALQYQDNGTYWIQVFYDATESSLPITFKLWDGTDEYTSDLATVTPTQEGTGTLASPLMIDFATTQTMTQTISMSSGWNWWSTPIELSNIDGLSMLESCLGADGIKIQSKNDGFVTRFDYQGNSMWYGTLEEIYNEQMYKVNMSNAHSSSIQGTVASLSAHEIVINNGWNWIGFPSNESISVSTAMAGFTPEANDQIKSKNDGFSTYIVYGAQAMWYGTLNTLVPGAGYMYKSNATQSKTLTYQNGRGDSPIANDTSENNVFVPNDASFADNMTITTVIELDGNEIRSDDYEVAAFVGNECRGSAKLMYVEPLDRYMAFLLIAGDVYESLDFVLTNGGCGDAKQSNDHLAYGNDLIIGTPVEPVVLHFDSFNVTKNGPRIANIFPNPVNRNESYTLNIPEGESATRLVIVNTLGEIVCNDSGALLLNHVKGISVSGVYTLKVFCQSGNVYIGKLVVK